MNNLTKGVTAGFAATVVLSAIMVAKGIMGLMPELNVIAMLANMMQSNPAMGWVAHFVIGTIAWGLLFALVNESLPGGGVVTKGIVFGVAAWVIMMIAVMPMAGAGVFAIKMGMMAPVMTLILHAIFGAVLGAVYGKLSTTPV